MGSKPVIVIFDIGKTNKKVFVFDETLNIVHEKSEHLPETTDDDGFPCEDVHNLTNWVKTQWQALLQSTNNWEVRALNVSGYGASFVHLGKDTKPATPLYNYLKPLPPEVRSSFHNRYPGIWAETASPDLDNLNSGLQLFMIKQAKRALFSQISHSLHLPQYISFALTGHLHSDLTSIGCHTALWDFTRWQYHHWVSAEGILPLQAETLSSDNALELRAQKGFIYSGIGLHDSSSALIPYLATQREPFCLLSTGTWGITLNPFNHSPLTTDQLAQDCLCYISYQGNPVKASRVFSGHFHDEQVAALAGYFKQPGDFYKTIGAAQLSTLSGNSPLRDISIPFKPFEAAAFSNYESAYVYLIEELVARQARSTMLVLSPQIKNIYVDGGFSHNALFMTLLAKAFPQHRVYAASVAQASALGAAIAIHKKWTDTPFQKDILKLIPY
jgi:sugar (pentulose or hexulose) kinase